MARPNFPTFLLPILLMFNAGNSFAVGQSAVITLVFPSGSRSMAMGEVGTALADDEQVLFYNPAGLGIKNDRWRGGAVTEFYEQILPAFKIPDLWHFHVAGAYQPRYMDVGGFALDWNLISFGTNDLTDGQGKIIGRAKSYEYVLGAAWGFNFADFGIKDHAFGVSLKYVHSELAPGIGPGDEGIGRTIAVDAGYLWQILPYLRFGFTSMNMGPGIFYISKDQQDPIPFTVNTALAYKDDFSAGNIRVLEICAEARLAREIVKNYPDKPPDPFYKAIFTGLINDTSMTLQEKIQETGITIGCEVTFLNTFSIRDGYLIDKAGQRFENHWGLGVRLFNHFQTDFYAIYSPEGYCKGLFAEGSSGARDGQWGITFTMTRMFCWPEKDHTWWIK